MKKIVNFVEKHGLIISLLFVMMAVLTGGTGISMAADVPVTDPDKDNPDPANPDVNDMDAPGGQHAGQNLPGTQGSATQMRRGGLASKEYDPDVVKFNAPKYVLLNLARTVAVQRTVKGYEIDHFRIGKANLTLRTTDDIAQAEKIVLSSDNVSGNLNMLGISKTVIVKGVKGYVDGSTTKTNGELVLIVTSVDEDGGTVTLRPLNGITKLEGQKSDYLQDYLVPAIEANTEMNIASYAGSESQKIVDPDNSQPRTDRVYLQKRLFNIVITDHEREILKETPWGFDEMRDQAIDNFSDQFETDLWNGEQKRWIVKVKGGNEEYSYTSRGILRQLTNTLGIDGKFKYSHIVAIGKIMFTKFAETTEAYLLCGRNKIGEIANMEEIQKQMDAVYKHNKTDYGIVVRDLVSNFGTLHVVYAPKMDELGYQDFCVAVPLQIARYYHKIKREGKIDLNEAGDDAREAMRYTYIEIAALALRGQNSMLIGPSDQIIDKNISDDTNPVIHIEDALPANPTDGMIIEFDGLLSEDGEVTPVSTLPADPTDGMIIAPTQDITVGTAPDTVTYEQGKYYIYETNAWSEYTGVVLDGSEHAYQWDADQEEWEVYNGTV